MDVAADEDGVAKVVYVEDADVSGSTDVIYALADTDPKIVRNSDISDYYEIDAVVNGEVVTLNVKTNSTAAEKLVTDIAANGADMYEVTEDEQWIVALEGITENSDGLVTTVSRYEKLSGGDGFTTGTGTGKAENETVLLDDERFAWDDEVVVVRYNYKGDFEVSRINSIKTDSNDQYVAVMDSNVIAGICIIEKDGGENSETTPGTVLDTILVTENDGKLTVHYYGDKPALEDALATIESWLEDQGMTLKDTTISGGKYTFTCTSSRGYTYEYTWDRSNDFDGDLQVITIDGNPVQYVVNGKDREAIDMTKYDNGGTGYAVDNGTSKFYRTYATEIDSRKCTGDLRIETGYITVTDDSSLTSGYKSDASNVKYMEAEGELTFLAAGTYKVNDEVVTVAKDEKYTVGDKNVTIISWVTDEAVANAVEDVIADLGIGGEGYAPQNCTVEVKGTTMNVTATTTTFSNISGTKTMELAKALIEDGYTITVINSNKDEYTMSGTTSNDKAALVEWLPTKDGMSTKFTVVIEKAGQGSVTYTVNFAIDVG